MVDDDGDLVLKIQDQPVLPCQRDRRTAWWAVIVAMLLAILATATALTFAVILIRERESFQSQVNQLRETIRNQDAALNCRAELNANLQTAQAKANQDSVDLLIGVADQFATVLSDERPQVFELRRLTVVARQTLGAARSQAAIYDKTVGQCALANNFGGD